MSLLDRNRRRLEVEPDPIDALGTDIDGDSRDWYTGSEEMKADVRGEKSGDTDFEVQHAPDYGAYADAASKSYNKDPFRPMATGTDEDV